MCFSMLLYRTQCDNKVFSRDVLSSQAAFNPARNGLHKSASEIWLIRHANLNSFVWYQNVVSI